MISKKWKMNARRILKDELSNILFIQRRFMKSFFFDKRACRILMYHTVEDFKPEVDNMGLAVTTSSFYMQMRYLKENGFYVMDLLELIDKIKKNLPIPERGIVISFDDGFRGVLINALPILRELDFRATLFVNINFIEQKLPRCQYWYNWKMLSWNEIRKLYNLSFTVGSHALTHRRLTGLNNEELVDEITKSKELIERNINNTISVFSYPQGAFNSKVIRVLKDSGFCSACSSIKGINGVSSDLFVLKRTEITGFDNTPVKFEKKILGCYDWLGTARRSYD